MCVCVTLKNNEVVSIGLNKRKFNKLVAKYKYPTYREYTLHAELDALIKSFNKQKLFDTMIVYRGATGLLDSKPCVYCSQWITELNVDVIYSEDNNIMKVHSKKLCGHYSYKELFTNKSGYFKLTLVKNGTTRYPENGSCYDTIYTQ